MGETNHRYDLVGERLTDRQGEMEKSLAGLKAYLMDVQQMMVYLNRAEPQVCVNSISMALCMCTIGEQVTKTGIAYLI